MWDKHGQKLSKTERFRRRKDSRLCPAHSIDTKNKRSGHDDDDLTDVNPEHLDVIAEVLELGAHLVDVVEQCIVLFLAPSELLD